MLAHDPEECSRSVPERFGIAMNHERAPRDIELFYGNLRENPPAELLRDGDAGDDRETETRPHEVLDALEAPELGDRVNRSPVSAEQRVQLLLRRLAAVVENESLVSQVPDAHVRSSCKRMVGWGDDGQPVAVDG